MHSNTPQYLRRCYLMNFALKTIWSMYPASMILQSYQKCRLIKSVSVHLIQVQACWHCVWMLLIYCLCFMQYLMSTFLWSGIPCRNILHRILLFLLLLFFLMQCNLRDQRSALNAGENQHSVLVFTLATCMQRFPAILLIILEAIKCESSFCPRCSSLSIFVCKGLNL